jgi:hypothetical protein
VGFYKERCKATLIDEGEYLVAFPGA